MAARNDSQDGRYAEAMTIHGPALERLSRAYERDADVRRDLMQEIQVALWRSFAGYDGRCSVRTWVYRVAHNVGATHVLKAKRRGPLADLEELEALPGSDDPEASAHQSQALARLMALIHGLKPADRQVMLLYLEDLDAAAISEVTGLSAGAVAVRIHRIKTLLAQKFHEATP
jgi:RNA polymerase sigma-70 factor (ECF subfamily)